MNSHISIKKIEISISGLSDKTVNKSFMEFDKELSSQSSQFLKGDLDLVDKSSIISVRNIHVDSEIHPGQLRKLVAERILKSMVPRKGITDLIIEYGENLNERCTNTL